MRQLISNIHSCVRTGPIIGYSFGTIYPLHTGHGDIEIDRVSDQNMQFDNLRVPAKVTDGKKMDLL